MLTRMKKTMRASMAFFVTFDPQLSPDLAHVHVVGRGVRRSGQRVGHVVLSVVLSGRRLRLRSAVTSICF